MPDSGAIPRASHCSTPSKDPGLHIVPSHRQTKARSTSLSSLGASARPLTEINGAPPEHVLEPVHAGTALHLGKHEAPPKGKSWHGWRADRSEDAAWGMRDRRCSPMAKRRLRELPENAARSGCLCLLPFHGDAMSTRPGKQVVSAR
jgi:hypothetical protein